MRLIARLPAALTVLFTRGDGIPKPDMSWDSLTTGLGTGVLFQA